MHEDIQTRAYHLWEADGRPDGADKAYWFKAVAETSAAAESAPKPARKRATRSKKAD
jgi:hypothetical protein